MRKILWKPSSRFPAGTSEALRSERGFSLIELLIVVAIFGLIATIATVEVSKTLKRQRVEAGATDVKGFLDRAFLQGQTQRVPIYVRINAAGADGSRWMDMIADDGGTPAAPVTNNALDAADTRVQRLLLPSDMNLSLDTVGGVGSSTAGPPNWPLVNGLPTLLVNTQGSSLDPAAASPEMLMYSAQLPVTHVEMVQGTLRPRLEFLVTVTPLWSVTVVKQTY